MISTIIKSSQRSNSQSCTSIFTMVHGMQQAYCSANLFGVGSSIPITQHIIIYLHLYIIITSHVPVQNVPARNEPMEWPPLLLLAAFLRNAHPTKTTSTTTSHLTLHLGPRKHTCQLRFLLRACSERACSYSSY